MYKPLNYINKKVEKVLAASLVSSLLLFACGTDNRVRQGPIEDVDSTAYNMKEDETVMDTTGLRQPDRVYADTVSRVGPAQSIDSTRERGNNGI